MSENPPPPPYNAPPPPDPYQQGAYQQPAQVGSGVAITALVLGVVSLIALLTVIGGIILGVIAAVVGFIALRKVKNGTGGGRGMAITGIVLGVIALLVGIGIVVAAALFVNSDTGKNLSDCLSKAGDSSAAQQKCQDDFRNKLTN